MPGPCSAPNGDRNLVNMSRGSRIQAAEARKLITGKTAKKREKEGKREISKQKSLQNVISLKISRPKGKPKRYERESGE